MTNHTALLPVEQIDRVQRIMTAYFAEQFDITEGDWRGCATKVVAALLPSAEAGEEVERVIRRTIPRVHLMISDGHYDGAAKILAEAITALRANAPEAGEVLEPVGGEAERAHIVAWLRSDKAWGLLRTYDRNLLADAIERGDHLASGAGDEG